MRIFDFKGVMANGQRRFDNFRPVVKSQGYNIGTNLEGGKAGLGEMNTSGG